MLSLGSLAALLTRQSLIALRPPRPSGHPEAPHAQSWENDLSNLQLGRSLTGLEYFPPKSWGFGDQRQFPCLGWTHMDGPFCYSPSTWGCVVPSQRSVVSSDWPQWKEVGLIPQSPHCTPPHPTPVPAAVGQMASASLAVSRLSAWDLLVWRWSGPYSLQPTDSDLSPCHVNFGET